MIRREYTWEEQESIRHLRKDLRLKVARDSYLHHRERYFRLKAERLEELSRSEVEN